MWFRTRAALKKRIKGIGILKRTVREFVRDDCPRMAAAMSYYTAFSLPPLLILVILIAGLFMDPDRVRGDIQQQMSSLLGPETAQQIRTMIDHARRPDFSGPLTLILSLGALIVSATGAFMQLQSALNRAWEVQPDPKKGGVKNFILKRLFSLGMVLIISFLLLVALVISTVLQAAGEIIGRFLPEGITTWLLMGVNFAVSFSIVTLLFAALFKVLPDARIAWKDVLFGAAITSGLFTAGKSLIGIYLGRSDPGNAFGAAGSFAVILVWIYYTSMILFLGAEFTHEWAIRKGARPPPETGATRVSRKQPWLVLTLRRLSGPRRA